MILVPCWEQQPSDNCLECLVDALVAAATELALPNADADLRLISAEVSEFVRDTATAPDAGVDMHTDDAMRIDSATVSENGHAESAPRIGRTAVHAHAGNANRLDLSALSSAFTS